MPNRIKVGVIGTGAIGAYVGGLLLLSPSAPTPEVIFVGRRASVGVELREKGLTLSDLTGMQKTIPSSRFTYSTDMNALVGCTHVLFAVKATSTEKLSSELKEIQWGATPPTLLSLQNGVHNADILRACLPHLIVLATVVNFNAIRVSDVHFHRTTLDSLVIEQDESPRASHAPFLTALSPMMACKAVKDIAPLQYGKLIINQANSLNALAGVPLHTQLSDPLHREIIAAVDEEALLVLRRASIAARGCQLVRQPWIMPHLLRLPNSIFLPLIRVSQKIDDKVTSSMAQDFQRGLPTEIEELNGEIVRLGVTHGVATPLSSKIRDMILEAEAKKKGCPKYSAEELASLLQVRPIGFIRSVRKMALCNPQFLVPILFVLFYSFFRALFFPVRY